jgi:hypothetical protein
MNDEAMQRLAKWRAHFAGWQLGTRTKDDPECQAVRDHREVTILLRAEFSALTGLLIEKGIFTAAEFTQALLNEADALAADYEARWPGAKATIDGMQYDKRATEWMSKWRP